MSVKGLEQGLVIVGSFLGFDLGCFLSSGFIVGGGG